ncbi:MAG: family 78 glycoside hydrolase catalytic domain [Dysgonomonas sp.]|nr:family 78 glycoside hydrolase catalytic domain [Dysgonomonas sp.]
MKNLKLLLSISFVIIFLFGACKSGLENTKITKTQCEYLDSPIGIDAKHPRFTWLFSGDAKDFKQKSYQVKIATKPELLAEIADVWVSGKITSSVPRAEYSGGKILESHTRYYWNVTVWDENGNEFISPTDFFEMAKNDKSDWDAKWITDHNDKEFEPAPMFRKEFAVDKDVIFARAYVSGTGYYEMYINGERIGKNYLDPGYTHFDKRILYVTHDVTSYIAGGKNAVAAVLGNGFYNCQSKAVWDFERARWRDRPRLLCEIRITYQDGTTEVIATDDTWKTNTGPYTYNNIYSGDRYDARLEEDGWRTANFDDSKWNTVQLTEEPAPILEAQQTRPIQITQELIPVEVKSFGDKIYVFDLGENIAGVCRLKVKGEKGTTFKLRHGELLKTNGRLEQGNINVYYRPEKQGEVFQEDIFILKGDEQEEVFMPQFSYHGFRYVEVECDRPVTLTADNLTGLFMHTNVPQVGRFESSNNLLNKIWEATNRSYKGNLHSIPTDCPQREKNGWTADAHIAMDLALLNFDGITLYEKWMNDYIDNQREDGVIAGIIPSSGWGYGDWPGPVWDAALFIIPNTLYDYYGEKRSIERLYPTMLKYLDYLKMKEVDGGYLNFGLGDWVFYKAQTPNDYTSTVYYYHDYMLMARFASILGKDASPYRLKADQLKKLINDKFFNAETGIYANGTQTAQAIALYMEIVPEGKEQLVAENLHKTVTDNNYFLDFGLLGSKTVPAMLTKYGYVEDAYKMATKTDAPSWGYWVETMGYTTLAETWTLSPEFRDASLNHVFMGDISAWMYNALAGINLDSSQPGFEHIIIRPNFVEDLTWVRAEYNSVRGMIKSGWKRESNRIELVVTIPLGSTATVYTDKAYTVGSGTHQFLIRQ